MIFFEVPTAAALAEAEENKDKVIRKPNRFYVQTDTSLTRLLATVSTIKQFPVINIQAGKSVLVNLQVPLRINGNVGACINTSVKVNGDKWYNLGNSGYVGGKASNSARGADLLCETKVLDLVSGLGLDPLADYNLQFYITGRVYNGDGYVNQYVAMNNTNVGGKGSRTTVGTDQNYMRLIVQEMD